MLHFKTVKKGFINCKNKKVNNFTFVMKTVYNIHIFDKEKFKN